jgi:hypothetical protein
MAKTAPGDKTRSALISEIRICSHNFKKKCSEGMAGRVYESDAWKSLVAHKMGVIDAIHLRDLMQVTPAAPYAAVMHPVEASPHATTVPVLLFLLFLLFLFLLFLLFLRCFS